MKTIRVVGDIREAFSIAIDVEDDFDVTTADPDDEAFQERVADALDRPLRLGREHALDIESIEASDEE